LRRDPCRLVGQVSIKGGHLKCQGMAKCQSKEVTENERKEVTEKKKSLRQSVEMRKSRSMAVVCSEAFSGWHVFDGVDERLVVWLPSSKAVKTDLVIGQIDFSSNETMSPKRIKEIMSSLDFDLTAMVGATQIDDSALERKLVIGLPVLWEWPSCRSRVDTWRGTQACGESKAIGTSLDGIVVVMHESLPDLLLPAAVETLDDGLEAGLMGWGEDRGDAELQTKPDDTTKGITKLTCSAKDGVVVKLSIFRESVSTPMSNQRLGGGLGGPRGSDPTGTQTCMHADASQDVDVGATTQTQVFDEVKAIDVRQPGSDAWQVPAFGRSRPANSSAPIESAAPQEDSSDGAEGWNLLETAFLEDKLDRHGTILAQVALVAELLTDSQDQILDVSRRGDIRAPTTARHARPNDAIQSLVSSVAHPTLHGCQCHTKLLCHRTQRASPSNSSYEIFAPRFNPIFCSRKAPGRKDIYNQCDLL
jgi:hypothetical protein